ncbi:MAG: enoyl-CoA hydratase/isomerase family protein [Geminicoccaceae bacterium]|nr:enoyl-CoA hydratase/isomerase family protein [Geminicoccaceae bacterium]
MATETHIRFSAVDGWGVVVLDRQGALNALTRPMMQAFSRQLARWHTDPAIGGVVLKAAPGRAFCAGGDVVQVRDHVLSGDVEGALAFFRDEYLLDWRLGTYPKPVVALMNGITMGGGVGLSVHGPYRVMTENVLFAMPETGIGFFPDVGASHALPRLAGRLGRYLGMTGARLKGGAAVAAGLGTHFVPAGRLGDCEAALLAAEPTEIEATLDRFAADPPADGLPPPDEVDALFAGPDAAAIVAALEAADGPFARATLTELRRKSPLSVAAVVPEIDRGAGLDLGDCLRREYAMVRPFLLRGDFVEGVRALLVDKDRTPRWRHGRIEDVTPDEAAAMLAGDEDPGLALHWDA